jgi:hypothetical protein
MKMIVISEDRWEELWKNFLDKMDAIQTKCQKDCQVHGIEHNVRRVYQYHAIGLKESVEKSRE